MVGMLGDHFRGLRHIVLVMLTALLLACDRKPPGKPVEFSSPAELVAYVQSQRDRAAAAQRGGEPAPAREAAELASQAVLRSRIEVGPADARIVQSLVMEAHATADLAEEERVLRETCEGWSAKTYRGARAVAVRGVFTGLALAADEMERRRSKDPRAEPGDAAELAASLASNLGTPLRDDGTPDWPKVSVAMTACAKSPPPRLHLLLGAAYLCSGRDGLALVELSDADPNAFPPGEVATLHLLRGVALRVHGCNQLALRETKMFIEQDSAAFVESELATRQSFMHLLTALIAIDEKDWERADVELMRASKAWPDNPVTVFITGERLNASGEWEKAAISLEAEAARLEDLPVAAKLAPLVAERARKIRDTKGAAERLFHDRALLSAMSKVVAAELAAESDTGKKAAEWLANAQGLGDRVLAAIPKGPWSGEPAATQPETATSQPE
jgi:hypothetical protein